MGRMSPKKLQEILKKHKLWLQGNKNGEQADLSEANLSGANLSEANLSGANLSGADLSVANLRWADLSEANLSGANLRWADLSEANLSGANLSEANLSEANLSKANLSGANLSKANLRWADLSEADLSVVEGLLSSINFMESHFERVDNGYIVYKTFGGTYTASDKWKIEPGSIIEEEVNPYRTNDCGCGINVAPYEWVKNQYPGKEIYKLLIKWEWLPGVVVPYNTDGKIRCAKAQIIEKVKEDEK